MSAIVNGASLQPMSGGKPKQIVLMLHGFGSNGADMIALAPQWQSAMPDALFVAPNAPEKCAIIGSGYQWWGLSGFAPSALAAGARMAAPAINKFLDRKLSQYDLTEKDLALVGFSQGTMMALQVGLRRARAPSSIVGYSGMLTSTGDLDQATMAKPPIMLIHGANDGVVPVGALGLAETGLRALGIDVASHISPMLGHSVDAAGIELGKQFVVKGFGR